ncbi:MAG: DUF2202 domain-containing protein [Actinomycetaceae bacterium]|nr:DUF2202 domain-containing protein [Actinomycetaceae bacterium]
MKVSTRIFAGVVAAIISTGVVAPMASAQTTTVTDAEAAEIAFMREEERLARDLYQAFADAYDDARPFSSIVKSEQRHFDRMGSLLEKYGIEDPSQGAVPGVYADQALQDLYDQWYAQGMTSIEDAYQVGVDLEALDIADLDDAIAVATTADVVTAFEQLKAGSENHLSAYQRNVDGVDCAGDGTGGYGTGRQASGQAGSQGQQGGGAGNALRQGNGSGQGTDSGQGAGAQGANGYGQGTASGEGTGSGQGQRQGAGSGEANGSQNGFLQRLQDCTGEGVQDGSCQN